jgi:hypothetical protein
MKNESPLEIVSAVKKIKPISDASKATENY